MKQIILALMVIGLSAPAWAQGRVCAKRDKLVGEIAKSHGETRQSIGLQRNSSVIETFANLDTGSWTIIVSLPTGISCLVAAGEAYTQDAQAAKDQAS